MHFPDSLDKEVIRDWRSIVTIVGSWPTEKIITPTSSSTELQAFPYEAADSSTAMIANQIHDLTMDPSRYPTSSLNRATLMGSSSMIAMLESGSTSKGRRIGLDHTKAVQQGEVSTFHYWAISRGNEHQYPHFTCLGLSPVQQELMTTH